MSIDPFARLSSRIDEDITGCVRPPMRTALANRCLIALTLVLIVTACGPTRPIPPARATTPVKQADSDFDADQLARLARLRVALDEGVSEDPLNGLVIRLAFDDVADLDLFVTDPDQESVYFANSPTRTGGRLIDDRRCVDASPRIETVQFEKPIPGRYRVGVDFHGSCDDTSESGDARKEGLYFVRVDDGNRSLERMGMLTPGVFEVIVLEFDVDE